jgi:NDP-sugar pyrophosphorylase family protein
MAERPTIHIAAGGNGTRIREGMDYMGFAPGFPKHLLPTGNGETLLGRIVRQTMEIGHPAIYANYDNVRHIGECEDIDTAATKLMIATNCNGPLSPMVHDIMRTKRTTYSCAGDFWADFKWGDFADFHENSDKPVTILVGPSVPTYEGARFNVADDGTVQSWERVDRTTEADLINIGAYIVDPEKLVLKKLRELSWHKEDPFNDTMIEGGLMQAYVLDSAAYNVNNPEVYASLVQASAQPVH